MYILLREWHQRRHAKAAAVYHEAQTLHLGGCAAARLKPSAVVFARQQLRPPQCNFLPSLSHFFFLSPSPCCLVGSFFFFVPLEASFFCFSFASLNCSKRHQRTLSGASHA
jgi:hypothetical protein